MTLHLLHSFNQLAACVGAAQSDDFVIVVGQAITDGLKQPELLQTLPCRVGVLSFELDTATTERPGGFSDVAILSDEQWVALTAIHRNQVAWT